LDIVQHGGRARQLRHRRARPGQGRPAYAGRCHPPTPGRSAQPPDRRLSQPGRGRSRALVHHPGLPGISALVGARRMKGEVGLNHNLGGIKGLWDKGKVAIVQGVGYPNPTFSHFASIRIWETGDPSRRQLDGWLGRTLATSYDSNGHPLTGCACGATDAPGALRDLQATLTVIQNQKTFGFTGGSEVEAAVGALYKGTPGIYGALFDTAIATATETMATL